MKKTDQTLLHEEKRLAAVHSYDLINTHRHDYLDNITSLASLLCNTGISLVSILDDSTQWFVSSTGTTLKKTQKDISICQYTIKQDDILEINDTYSTPEFNSNPLVHGNLNMRFYAGVPLKDPDGYNIGALCVIDNKPRRLNDIQKTSLKILAKAVMDYIVLQRTKNHITKLNSQLDNFFELSPDFLCTASSDGYFQKVNSTFSRELGYTRDELLKVPFLDFVHPDDKGKTIDVLKNINMKSATVMFFRNRYLRKDGSYIWMSWNAIPDIETGLIIATARNVTELIRMEEELKGKKNLEKRLTEEKFAQLINLTSQISHEILNPINLVIGFADITLDMIKEITPLTTEEERENILASIKSDQEKILEHSRGINALIHKMNHDVDNNYIPSIYQRNNISNEQEINILCTEFAKIAFNNFKQRFNNFECEINYSLEPKNPKSRISIADFGESILSVLNNAFEAVINMKKRNSDFLPVLSLKTSQKNGNIDIRITNNGPKIPADISDKIFIPFFTTKHNGQKGIGLGLATSYSILKNNNGSIVLEKSDSKETTFKITLPLSVNT